MVKLPEASPSPESNKFNPADFPAGTDILFFDDSSKEWKLGMVNTWANPVKDSDGNLNGSFWISGSGTGDLKLSSPPKKIDKIPSSADFFDINGKKYKVDINKTNVIQDTHEVELTLVNIANSADRLENINLKTIKNLESVEQFETDIETRVQKLKTDVLTKADARTKDIFVGLINLQTEIVKVAEQLGALSEWQDIGQAEAEQIGQSIKELQTKINTDLADLENKLKNIEARKDGKDSSSDEADGLQTRLDRETKNKTKKNIEDHKTAVDNAKTVHDSWKKDKAEWDKKKKAKEDWDKLADKKGKPDPGDPGTEPTEPPKPESIKSPEVDQAKIDAAFDLFTALETSTATLPATDKFKQIIKKVKDLADIEAKREGFGDFTRYDNDTKKEVVAKIFQEVLNKEKGNVAVEGEKFDLNKEKEDLKTKIKEIMARAEAAGVLVVPGFTNEQETAQWSKGVDGIPVNITEKQQEGIVLNHWNLISERELLAFEAEHKKSPKTERVESEKDIDIPDSLLVELLTTKRTEVQAAMKELYSGSLNLGSADNKNIKMLDAVKDIFDSQPPTDPAIRNKLAEHGIRNWNTFKKSWDKKLHIQVAEVLSEWAKGQLKNRAQGGVMNFLKNNGGGALVNMGVSLGLTYGGAQLGGLLAERFTGNVTDAANRAAIGVASKIGGGTLAGVAKAGFHKLTGGIFARKQEAKAQSAEEKAIEALVRATGMDDFSSVLAQSLRDISSEAVGGEVKDFAFDEAKKLKGDARRTYINHLKKMRAEGKEISDKIRLSLAISCEELMGNLEIKQEQFATPEHMGIITAIEEGQKYLGYKKGVVAGALVGAGVTTAFVGAAQLGANYVPILSGVLGAAGGMTMGYRMADKWHEGSKMKSGKKNFVALFEQTNSVFTQYKADKDVQVNVTQKGFFKDAKEKKSANDVLMENIQRINRLLKGKADSESDLEMMQYLNSDPNLLARAKNLLYESHRSGLFAEQALVKLQEQAEKMRKEAETVEFSKNKKQAIRALGAIVGGAVVGGISMSIGFAFAQHRLESLTDQKIEANAKNFEAIGKIKRAMVDAAVVASAPKVEVPVPAAAPVEITPVAPAAEVAPHHPAGLIEAPTGVKTFHAWEQKMFKSMGYTKLPNGDIQHTFRYHADQPDITHKGEIVPGTKFILTKPDGTPISVKDHVVEYKFKHGDSYSSAMDHMKHNIKIAIAAGETPTIKMEGHIDVGDGKGNYIIEHHSGGHTHMESGEAVPEAKGKQFDWSGEKVEGVHDVPKGNFDLSTVEAGDSGVFTAADGLEYQQQPGGATADYYVHNNHLYTFEGKYIGEQYLPTESHAGKTSWSSGGAVADKPALEAMLKGTIPGGASEVAVPQPGIPKGGGIVEVGKPVAAEIVADKVASAPVAEAKAGTPATAVAEVVPAGMPKAWEGHVTEYKGLQGMKLNIEAAIQSGQTLEVDVSHDKLKVLSGLMNDIEKGLAKSPNLMDQKALHDALDPNSTVPLDARLLKLVTVLDNNKNITLSSAERLLLGDTFTDGDKFFHTDIIRNGQTVEAWVDKKGSNAVVYVDKETGHRELVTDPKVKFDPDNLGNAKKGLTSDKSSIKLGKE